MSITFRIEATSDIEADALEAEGAPTLKWQHEVLLNWLGSYGPLVETGTEDVDYRWER